MTTVLKIEKQMQNMQKIVSKHIPKEVIEEEEPTEKVDEVEIKREGIMFTSSVAMSLKLKDLEEATDSKIEKE